MKTASPQRLRALLSRGLQGEELNNYQRDRLVEICAHASQNVPFYRTRLANLRYTGFSSREWASIPVLSRDEVAKDWVSLKSKIQVQQAGPSRSVTTSGTSGQPLQFEVNKLSDVMSQMAYLRYFKSWDINHSLTILTARNPKTAADRQSGEIKVSPLPGGGGVEYTSFTLEPDRVCHLIESYRPTYLRTFPSVAYETALVAKNRGLKHKLKLVMTVGETLRPEFRDVVQDVFGCSVADVYATEELQLVAYSCKDCGNYHCTNENLYIELLDHQNNVVPVGTEGRVVVTTLNNFCMPLIRYELNDVVVRGAATGQCAKRGLVLARILGRERNMFHLTGGRRIWPSIPAPELLGRGIKLFQLVQTQQNHVLFKYNTITGNPISEEELRALARSYIDAELNVQVHFDDNIRPSGSGKLMHYLSTVAT